MKVIVLENVKAKVKDSKEIRIPSDEFSKKQQCIFLTSKEYDKEILLSINYKNNLLKIFGSKDLSEIKGEMIVVYSEKWYANSTEVDIIKYNIFISPKKKKALIIDCNKGHDYILTIGEYIYESNLLGYMSEQEVSKIYNILRE